MTRLDIRVLNRTLLARQQLLERSTRPVSELLEHLIGLQAQDVPPPFIALWNRLADFDPDVVSRGLEDRSLGRITLMRGTIHLVTARDALRIAPHVQPELEKVPFRKGFNYGATVGLDPDDVRARAEAMIDGEPITAAALRERVAAEWPDRNASALLAAILLLLPVMQVPPRGRWNNNSRPTWARTEAWFGAPLDDSYPVDELVLRYLRAFGPASTMDMQTWSKLTGLAEVVARLGGKLRHYTDERGRTLYDVADGNLAEPDQPAPVRFLPWYDNALLSHQDRTRIIPEHIAPALTGVRNLSTVLVDGFVAASYAISATAQKATLQLRPLMTLTRAAHAAAEAEGLGLLEFLHPGRAHEYRVLT